MIKLPILILLMLSSLIGEHDSFVSKEANPFSIKNIDIVNQSSKETKNSNTKNLKNDSKNNEVKNERPVYDNVPMDEEVLDYIYEKSVEMEFDYTTLLAIISVESDFGRVKINKNKDGSIDRGIMQFNSSNINWVKKRAGIKNPDLFDYKDNINMALSLMDYEREYFIDKGYSKKKLEWITIYAYHRGRGNAIKMSKNSNWEHIYVTKVYNHKKKIEGGKL